MDWTGCSLSPGLPSPTPTQSEAVEMMDQIVHWVRKDPSGLGRPWLSGTPASESMAVPMMLLNLVEADQELASNYAKPGDWCAQRILWHIQVGDRRLMPAARWGLASGEQGIPHYPPLRAPPLPTPTLNLGPAGPLHRWETQGGSTRER